MLQLHDNSHMRDHMGQVQEVGPSRNDIQLYSTGGGTALQENTGTGVPVRIWRATKKEANW